MNKHSDDFATLRKALSLKKHEKPGSVYFEKLSDSIRKSIESSSDTIQLEYTGEQDEEFLRKSISKWFSEDSEPKAISDNPSSKNQNSGWLEFLRSVFYGIDLKPALVGVYAVATVGLVFLGFMIGANPESNPSLPNGSLAESLPHPFNSWFKQSETIATQALEESSERSDANWPLFWKAAASGKTTRSSLMDGFLTTKGVSSVESDPGLWRAHSTSLEADHMDQSGIGLWRNPAWGLPQDALRVSTNSNELPPHLFDPIELQTYPAKY
jgi:hypothetical protein